MSDAMSDAMSDSLFNMRAREPSCHAKVHACIFCCDKSASTVIVHFVHRSRESHIARWEKSFPLSLIASQKYTRASAIKICSA